MEHTNTTMANSTCNETFALDNCTIQIGTFSVGSPEGILVLEAKDLLYPHMLDIQRPIFYWSSFCVVWICVLIVSYFRYILYDYLLKQYTQKELKPIDILTFWVAFIDHLSCTMIILYGTIMIITGSNQFEFIGGKWLCSVFIYIIRFGKGYSFIGGLMVSIYRIILIMDWHWAKVTLGLKNLYRIIVFVGFSLAISSSILESYNDYEHLNRNTCQLTNRRPIMMMLDEYEQSLGNPSIYSWWITTMLTISYSRIFMVVLEVIIYATFFHHMYKHDNNELLRRLLDPNVTRNRNRTNAITFFGQFCSFAIEFIWIILYIITIPLEELHKKGGHPLISARFIVRMISYTCIPIIEVVTSKTLRAKVYRFSLYEFIFGLN